MATATKLTRRVLLPPLVLQYKDVDDGVTLRLTTREAVVLRALLRSVGGDQNTTVRAQTNDIDKALDSAGIPEFDLKSHLFLGHLHGYYPPDGSAKVLDELLAQNEKNASLVKANQDLGQAVQANPQTMKDAYTQAGKQLNLPAEKRYVGFSPVLGMDFAKAPEPWINTKY